MNLHIKSLLPSYNDPRKRKPTEKVLEQMENLQNHGTLGEEEQRRTNSKSKKNVKEAEAGGEKENDNKNVEAVSTEETTKSIDTGKRKNTSAKREATANVVEEKQTKKAKKAKSNETDAKINASKEAAMKLFYENYFELELTEVDERQTTHLHWPEVPVGRKATAQKEKGKQFRELLNMNYPELTDDPDNNPVPDNPPASQVQNDPSTSHLAPINYPSANHLAQHYPPANHVMPNITSQSESFMVPIPSTLSAKKAITPSPLQEKSPSNQPTSMLQDHIGPYSTLLRPELVSHLVSALRTVNSPEELCI